MQLSGGGAAQDSRVPRAVCGCLQGLRTWIVVLGKSFPVHDRYVNIQCILGFSAPETYRWDTSPCGSSYALCGVKG